MKILDVLPKEAILADLKAVDNLSVTAYCGEVFGLIGPNGAGKTTMLEMIEGLRTVALRAPSLSLSIFIVPLKFCK